MHRYGIDVKHLCEVSDFYKIRADTLDNFIYLVYNVYKGKYYQYKQKKGNKSMNIMIKRALSIIISTTILLAAFAFTASAQEKASDMISNDGFVYNVTDGIASVWQYVGDAEEITVPETIDGYTVKSVGSFQYFADGYEINNEQVNFSSTLKSIVIPEGVEKIKLYCSNIEEISLPLSADGNVSVYQSAVKTLDVPEGYTVMPSVKWCDKLTCVSLPETLKTIHDETFWGCVDLAEITVPKSVVNVTANAFVSENDARDFTVNCYANSAAHKACVNAGITVNLLDTYYGDANGDGDINLLDLITIRKHLAKWQNIEINLDNADCNGDGDVNLLDLILMRKHLARWVVLFGPQS